MFCCIGCLFQLMHDLFNFNQFDTVFFFFKEFSDKEFVNIVRLILYIM